MNCSFTAVSRKVVQQNGTRQCRNALLIMGIYGPRSRLQVLQWDRRKQHKQMYLSLLFFLLVNTVNLSLRQTLSTHNTNRHCRVRFYDFVKQPLSNQLYMKSFTVDWQFGALLASTPLTLYSKDGRGDILFDSIWLRNLRSTKCLCSLVVSVALCINPNAWFGVFGRLQH